MVRVRSYQQVVLMITSQQVVFIVCGRTEPSDVLPRAIGY